MSGVVSFSGGTSATATAGGASDALPSNDDANGAEAVRVALRIRPAQCAAADARIRRSEATEFPLEGERHQAAVAAEKGDATLTFIFDRVFGGATAVEPERSSTTSNSSSALAEEEELYEWLGAKSVADVHRGLSASLLAYGQTGSGKTYTMMGPALAAGLRPELGSAGVARGLVPRVLQEVFASGSQKEPGDSMHPQRHLEIGVLEIYNEHLSDLLEAAGGTSVLRKQQPRQQQPLSPTPAPAVQPAPAVSPVVMRFVSTASDTAPMSDGSSPSASTTVGLADSHVDPMFLGTDPLGTSLQQFETASPVCPALADTSQSSATPPPPISGDIPRLPGSAARRGSIRGKAKATPAPAKPLAIRECSQRGTFVENLRMVPVRTFDEALTAVAAAQRCRQVAATRMNARSSRSHAIVLLKVVGGVRGDGAPLPARHLYMADLAGSERVKQTGASGQQLQEAKHINLSLSTLGRVIDALAAVSGDPLAVSHAPFRDSKLTFLLKPAFGGSSSCGIVATVSPDPAHIDESISTLRYATKAKAIITAPTVLDQATALGPAAAAALVKRVRDLELLVARLSTAANPYHHRLLPDGECADNVDQAPPSEYKQPAASSPSPQSTSHAFARSGGVGPSGSSIGPMDSASPDEDDGNGSTRSTTTTTGPSATPPPATFLNSPGGSSASGAARRTTTVTPTSAATSKVGRGAKPSLRSPPQRPAGTARRVVAGSSGAPRLPPAHRAGARALATTPALKVVEDAEASARIDLVADHAATLGALRAVAGAGQPTGARQLVEDALWDTCVRSERALEVKAGLLAQELHLVQAQLAEVEDLNVQLHVQLLQAEVANRP